MAAAKAGAATNSPFVPNLTRVVLEKGDALVFMTLSAVNPQATLAERRYVAEVWSAGLRAGESTSWETFTPGVQIPTEAMVGRNQLVYSVVPDTVSSVAWYYKCSSGCGQLPGSPLVVPVHGNVAYSPVTAGSWSINRAIWYLRGPGKQLQSTGP